MAAGTATADLSGLTEHNGYTYKAYDKRGCADRDEIGSVTFTPTDDALTASKVTETTATLTLTGHTHNTDHQRDTGHYGQLVAQARHARRHHLQGQEQDVHGRPDATYRRHGLRLPGLRREHLRRCRRDCPGGLHHPGPGHRQQPDRGERTAPSQSAMVFGGPYKYSTAFRTGSNGGGYELDSVTFHLSAPSGPDGGLTAKIFTANITDTGDLEHGGSPNALVKNMGTKATPGTGKVNWDCDCDLQADTIYHLVLEIDESATSGNYNWTSTSLEHRGRHAGRRRVEDSQQTAGEQSCRGMV